MPRGLAIARKLGWTFDIMSTSFFVSRRSIKPAAQSGMPLWQDKLFIALARNASDATDFFQIPTGRVVEVGHAGDGVDQVDGRLVPASFAALPAEAAQRARDSFGRPAGPSPPPRHGRAWPGHPRLADGPGKVVDARAKPGQDDWRGVGALEKSDSATHRQVGSCSQDEDRCR